MTSILDRHATDMDQHHHCGGTILGGPDHAYCDRCGAVAYYDDELEERTWDDAVRRLATLDEGEDNL